MQRQLTINYQFQLLAIDLRLLDKTFGSNLTGGQCSCPVAACARGGVAKSGSRWGVACWQRQGIAMNRRLASAWCGSQQDQAHSNVFPFSLFLFSSSRWESVATQAFARFLSFPTHPFHVPSRNDRRELLGAVVWPSGQGQQIGVGLGPRPGLGLGQHRDPANSISTQIGRAVALVVGNMYYLREKTQPDIVFGFRIYEEEKSSRKTFDVSCDLKGSKKKYQSCLKLRRIGREKMPFYPQSQIHKSKI